MTTTTVNTPPRAVGRMITRSTAIPPAKAIPIVAAKAAQYDTPHSMSWKVMYVVNIAIPPCAKLITSVAR